MPYLEIKNLTHTFVERQLYSNAEFLLHKGDHIGLVGLNGAGKSTLIRFMTGDLSPDFGTVVWQDKLNVAFMDQYVSVDPSLTIHGYLSTTYKELFDLEARMNAYYLESIEDEDALRKASNIQERLLQADFYTIETEIQKVIQGLGLHLLGSDTKIEHLSGGQRAKVILGKLLLSDADVLLLDEPTNFLDVDHIEWLANYLNAYAKSFIVVSHDDSFINRVANVIVDIDFQKITRYNGNYNAFLKQKEHNRMEQLSLYSKQQNYIDKTEAFIRKNKAGGNAKMARGRQKQLNRLDRVHAPLAHAKQNYAFKTLSQANVRVLETLELAIGYDSVLIDGFNMKIYGGERFAITGFNGIGKSTLIKTIMGQLKPLDGSIYLNDDLKIGYFEQSLNWSDDTLTPLQIVSQTYPKFSQGEVRKTLASVGMKEEHWSRSIKTLSGGEQTKVKLCLLMNRYTNMLVLDEPTNHLDIESKDALKFALQSYTGTIILVSHEASFYEDWIDKIISIRKIKNLRW
ncbi:ABC transporter ATP-binding protein [Erysipelothrix rhusiopathiae SY1027]|uniref:ABC-F family ATP-binding cassette domain-containing protein n=1 Tax=Erysipelothrix rhusiopathiae TaxID=1648 RepID=UPI0003348B1D|nr:ABC-F family ATP-binding cassette domain-containing protein [Erysipelothrix rhusiopathiae]AGN24022.1 ABC transporter ATP-binding protein [Erysipelothrix rhusiopathiae SY1027]